MVEHGARHQPIPTPAGDLNDSVVLAWPRIPFLWKIAQSGRLAEIRVRPSIAGEAEPSMTMV